MSPLQEGWKVTMEVDAPALHTTNYWTAHFECVNCVSCEFMSQWNTCFKKSSGSSMLIFVLTSWTRSVKMVWFLSSPSEIPPTQYSGNCPRNTSAEVCWMTDYWTRVSTACPKHMNLFCAQEPTLHAGSILVNSGTSCKACFGVHLFCTLAQFFL